MSACFHGHDTLLPWPFRQPVTLCPSTKGDSSFPTDPHPSRSWYTISTCAACEEGEGVLTKGALLPGLLLGGDAWGDLSGDLAGLWDTGRGEEALGRLSGKVLELPCSTGGDDCEEGGEGGEGGGGGVTLGKRSLRKPGRNWSIRVQVTPHSFV